MLYAWNPDTRLLEAGRDPAGARWLHAVSPTEDERARLLRDLKLPDGFLAHALDPDELPRLDHDAGGARLVMLRAPLGATRVDLPYRTVSIAVLLAGNVIVTATVAEGALERLDALHTLDPSSPTRFVLQLLQRVAERFLADVREIDRRVDALEDRLEVSQRNEEVLGLLRFQKGLVHFETALSADRIMLERLQRDEGFHKTEEDAALLEDALVEFRQASEMVSISTNILSQMMDAFASIISNNLNVVMKVLTALTVLSGVPMLIASLYGMNVPLPLQHHPLAFAFVLGLSAALAVALASFFQRRRWM